MSAKYKCSTHISRRSVCISGLGFIAAGLGLKVKNVLGAAGFSTAGTSGQTLLTRQNNFSTAAIWSPDGKMIASGGITSPLEIWDALTGKTLVTLKANDGVLLDWSPDSKYLVAAGGIEQTVLSGTVTSEPAHLPLASAIVRVWNAKTGAQIATYTGMSYINAVAWSPDGTRIAVSGSDKTGATVHVYSAQTGKRLLAYRGHVVSRLTWSPNSRFIVSSIDSIIGGVFKRSIHVWNSSTGQDMLVLAGSANALAWSPDGSFIAYDDGESVNVFKAKTGQRASTYPLHTGAPILAIRWSPDGRFLACGGGSPQFPDPKGFALVRTLATDQTTFYHGHSLTVTSLAWSPASDRIVTTSYDGTVRVWSAS